LMGCSSSNSQQASTSMRNHSASLYCCLARWSSVLPFPDSGPPAHCLINVLTYAVLSIIVPVFSIVVFLRCRFIRIHPLLQSANTPQQLVGDGLWRFAR